MKGQLIRGSDGAMRLREQCRTGLQWQFKTLEWRFAVTISASDMRIDNFQNETATVNGIRLHYWLGGDPAGPPVLLWHGFPGTSYTWHRVMPLLAKAGYAVLAPDMRGYGDSDKPSGTIGYDARSLAEEFRSLVRQIGFGAGRALTLVAHDKGGPPALLWTADHPDEILGVLYIEAPVMLKEVIEAINSFTPDAVKKGSKWWWTLPLATGVPECLIVGKEREFLNLFYKGPAVAKQDAITPEVIEEYLRTFSGTEGVLGALGVYRAVFNTIEQTTPLMTKKIMRPIVGIGGERSLGAEVGRYVSMVASNSTSLVLPGCGHFVPEECPEAVFKQIQSFVAWQTLRRSLLIG
jgi:pimeloyl-ACP methyl ester carboxylesterase